VTVGTGSERSLPPFEPEHGSAGRSALLLAALVLLLASLVPPVATEARRYEVAEAIQFCLLAVAIPALLVMGAPWRRLGLAGREARVPDDEGTPTPTMAPRPPVDRLAEGRRRHPEVWRSVGFFGLYLAGAVLWRTPPAVNGLARHPWLVVVEAVTLVSVGTGLWLELVESPPLTPRLSRPHRVALAAVSMWLIWVLAYLVGLSHVSWYHAYPHHPGSGLSLSADQQLTTGMMWFISGCAFIPVVFWNLVRWLQSEEDPDQELHHLIRQERIRGRTVEGGPATP
jgi:cytochrome c oxidase assembly factor CtaG